MINIQLLNCLSVSNEEVKNFLVEYISNRLNFVPSFLYTQTIMMVHHVSYEKSNQKKIVENILLVRQESPQTNGFAENTGSDKFLFQLASYTSRSVDFPFKFSFYRKISISTFHSKEFKKCFFHLPPKSLIRVGYPDSQRDH